MSLSIDPPADLDLEHLPSLVAGGGDRGWLIVVGIIAGLVALPLMVLVIMALEPGTADWALLFASVLPKSAWTTLKLMLGVGVVTSVVGVATAWLVAMCRFPGRGLFQWALLLPLSIPTYIVAYAHVEVLDYTGPVQTAIRALFGFKSARDYWFPDIRSLGSAIFVMSAVLYPYVHLSARAMFQLQSAATLDVARTLGAGPWRVFFRVALPLARPAVALGVTLALMECLNDIGAVEYLGVKTLTFSVYDTWLNRGSLAGAAQIASVMLVIVFALLSAERYARRHQRFHGGAARSRPVSGYPLSRGRAIAAILVCAAPVLIGFVVPAAVLVDYASRRLDVLSDPALARAGLNSLILSLAAAAVTVAVGLSIAYALRIRRDPIIRLLARVGSVGYAVPGTVLAVGILMPLTQVDNWLDSTTKALFGIGTGLITVSSGGALIYAYVVRFLAASFGAIESGLSKITIHLDMAARMLGRSAGRTLIEIHLPMIRPVLMSAGLLVFVDVMKELPATLLLRPFNFETLATWVYAQASREAIGDAAPAALAIIVVGLAPVIMLARMGGERRLGKNRRRRPSRMASEPVQA